MNNTTATAVRHSQIYELRTYTMSAIFVAGNIVLPQLCHLVPRGGLVWLPIYFFTLIAAYRYGIVAGLITAICSPIANNLLFGMPTTPMLAVILAKSCLLSAIAALLSWRTRKVALWTVALTVAGYQLLGSLVEWALTDSYIAALQDLRIGWPGMLLQIFGGWLLMKRGSIHRRN